MEPLDWKKVLAEMEYQASKPKYAPRFYWRGDQGQEEHFVMRDFLTALKANGELNFSKVRPFRPDPPDFIADATDGTTIAFELREFVSQEARRRTTEGERVMARWNDEQFFHSIDNIIREKDEKTFNGGPYSRIILLVPTDEYNITPDMVERVFSARQFDKPRNITEGFLMMDAVITRLPQPGVPIEPEVCPIFKMQFH